MAPVCYKKGSMATCQPCCPMNHNLNDLPHGMDHYLLSFLPIIKSHNNKHLFPNKEGLNAEEQNSRLSQEDMQEKPTGLIAGESR